MKKADIVIVVSLLVLALGIGIGAKISYSHKYAREYVQIQVKNQIYKKILIPNKNFKDTITIKTNLGMNVIRIENGGVRIIDADCPDKICVKDGFIDKPGRSLVCLPHKVAVEIKGEDKAETDEVSY